MPPALHGRLATLRPAVAADAQALLAILDQSAHLPHLEEPERFREAAEGFLDRVEGGAA